MIYHYLHTVMIVPIDSAGDIRLWAPKWPCCHHQETDWARAVVLKQCAGWLVKVLVIVRTRCPRQVWMRASCGYLGAIHGCPER